jgi:hypothetical protein
LGGGVLLLVPPQPDVKRILTIAVAAMSKREAHL